MTGIGQAVPCLAKRHKTRPWRIAAFHVEFVQDTKSQIARPVLRRRISGQCGQDVRGSPHRNGEDSHSCLVVVQSIAMQLRRCLIAAAECRNAPWQESWNHQLARAAAGSAVFCPSLHHLRRPVPRKGVVAVPDPEIPSREALATNRTSDGPGEVRSLAVRDARLS